MKRTRSQWRFVLGGLILSLVWASPIGAQEQPILRFEGLVTYPAPSEMLVALDSGGVVMLDLARMRQREIRQIAQKSLELPAARAPGTGPRFAGRRTGRAFRNPSRRGQPR